MWAFIGANVKEYTMCVNANEKYNCVKARKIPLSVCTEKFGI